MSRKELLIKLLSFDISINDITDRLNKLSWDFKEEYVFLERKHILNILKKYLAGELSEDVVEDWANLIENREDIGREKSYEALINDILYELANPLLSERLTKKNALSLIAKIS